MDWMVVIYFVDGKHEPIPVKFPSFREAQEYAVLMQEQDHISTVNLWRKVDF